MGVLHVMNAVVSRERMMDGQAVILEFSNGIFACFMVREGEKSAILQANIDKCAI